MNSDHLQNTPSPRPNRKSNSAISPSPRTHIAVSALNTVRAVSTLLRRVSLAARQKFGKQSRDSRGLSRRSAVALIKGKSLSTVPCNAECMSRGTGHE